MRKVTILYITILAVPCFATTINVKKGGSGDYTTIQAAIDAAETGDTIIVHEETYTENLDMLGKAITLRSTDPMDPNVVLNTIIDGNQAGSVITCNSDEGPDTVISGFVITNGYANSGGGMYNNYSSPTVTNCTFSENTASAYGGGGVYNYYSSTTVTNCTFSKNTAGTYGGGIYFDNCQESAVINCMFSSNVSEFAGGGMYSGYSPVIVTDCTFSENMAVYGGGMHNLYSSLTVTNCTFSGNTADTSGAGMFNDASSPTLNNCTFSGGSAGTSGGGIYNDILGSPIINNCTFSANTAGTSGGGIYSYSAAWPALTASYFCSNEPEAIYGSYIDNGGNNLQFCPPPKPIVEGDIDGDGDVDLEDFAMMAANWLLGTD